ncbi:hypothetical protein Patl1_14930 [Pistacia atlantica]|uniref:Uncharacterized protein n=1 Tax=Pistacia atlantica TaxID=434234 RepID=A0ACC1B7T8_9ROSI|nr:hypothetical protein Patl1_14930 [Pistacia atlantica]
MRRKKEEVRREERGKSTELPLGNNQSRGGLNGRENQDGQPGEQRGREANPNPQPFQEELEEGRTSPWDVIASMEARVMRNEVNVAEVKEHLDVLDQKMDDVEGMVETMGEFRQHVADKHQAFEEFQVVVLDSLRTLQAQVEELRSGLEESKGDWAFCKRAVANGVVTNAAPPARVKVPRPRKYGGKRDAQEAGELSMVHGEVLRGYQCPK